MGMTKVPLGVGSTVRNRADAPPISLINRFFESNPANLEEQVALIERPALVELLDAGSGPGRRLYTEPGFSDGDLFHVSDESLYKHHREDDGSITTTLIAGTIGNSPYAPDIAATPERLFITDQILLQWTDGASSLATIVTPDDIPMISLDVFNGYVLCVQSDSDRFYWIQPGAIIIDPLDFATAERFPDKILQVRVVGDEFWLLGEKSIEVWRATGDGDAPFQRIEGRAYNFGVFGGTGVRMKDTSVMLVAHDGTVFGVAGTPTAISNPSIAEQTRDAIKTAIDNNED
jgi:hypothetical protein